MSLRSWCRTVVMLLGGLLLGAFGLLAGVTLTAGPAAAAVSTTCTVSGGVASIAIGDGATTVTDVAGVLEVDGAATTCGAGAVFGTTVTTVSLSLATGAAPTDVTVTAIPANLAVNEDTAAGPISCSATISGSITGTTATLTVEGASGESIVAGAGGVNTDTCATAATPPVAFANVTVTGMTAEDLVGGGGTATLSADGGSGTGAPTTLPTTLDGSVVSGTYNLVGGNGTDTFKGSSTGSTATVPSNTDTPPAAAAYTLSGNVTLVGSTGSYAITATGSGNKVMAGAGIEEYTLNGNDVALTAGPATTDQDTFTVTGIGNTLTGGAGTDTFNEDGCVTTTCGNVFMAGSGTDTFTSAGNGDTFFPGSGTASFYAAGTGNTLNFSNVGTSGSDQLTINASGAPQTVGTADSPIHLDNGEASVAGQTADYTFLDSVDSTEANDFTTFVGAASGNTQFLTGAVGGLAFTGGGQSNSAIFFGNPSDPSGVVVDLSGNLTTSAVITQGGTALANFPLSEGQVLVADPGADTSCGSPLQLICDSLSDVTTVTGPTTGFSTFFAGAGPATYTFSDAGNSNTFNGGSGIDNFSSGGNDNDFVAGSGSATFTESTTTQGASNANTIDFSNVPVGPTAALTINVSGTNTAVANYQAGLLTANQTLSTYSFGNGGPDFTTFIGAAGGDTTFEGGSGNYTYTGQGTGNTLSFAGVPATTASSLTFDVTHTPNPQATLGSVPEVFSGITTLVGLAAGGTQFVGGVTGGYTFQGNGSGNQAIFTPQGASTNLTATVTLPAGVTGGTVSFTLAGGELLCTPIPVLDSNGTFTASCSAPAVPVGDQVIATYAPPSGVAAGVSGVVVTPLAKNVTLPATATVTTLLPFATETQGETEDLQATVSSPGSPGSLPAGTVKFTTTDGTVLCSGASPAGGGTASCAYSFPTAGDFDIIAVFTPSGSTFSASADLAPVTVNPPPVTTTTVASEGCGFVYDEFGFPIETICTIQATVNPAAGGALPGGTITLTQAGATGTLCSYGFSQGDSSSFSCEVADFPDGAQILAVYTPTPSTSNPVSSSAGSAVISDYPYYEYFFNAPIQTSTALKSSAPTVTQGSSVTLTATVTAEAGFTLPSVTGGTVTFSVVGGLTLCTANVPGSGGTSAMVSCSSPFATVSNDEIIAIYTPPSSVASTSSPSFTVGSASEVSLAVTASPATSTAVSFGNGTAGVFVNLSGTATPNKDGVMVGPGVVKVSAPLGTTTSCTASSLSVFCDSLSDISTVDGSADGGNTFVAGSGSETFGDTGDVGGDAIDFANVPTSSTTPLTVNVSGAPVSGVANDTATAGATYTFTTGGSGFTTFTGSSSGNTSFLAGATGGYSFTASGANDSIDFSAVPTGTQMGGEPLGVTVDLSGGTSGTVTLPGGGTPDMIAGLTTVVGSSGGGNMFTAGADGPYTFTGNGNYNTFVGGTGTDVFTSSGSNNTFTAGAGSATFNDTGSANTVNFGNLADTNLLTVNVSGVQVEATPTDTASASSSTYVFTSFGNAPTTFLGSPGGTTFYAGSASDTFTGNAATPTTNTLTFAEASSAGPLVFCLGVTGTGCPSPAASEAVLGSVKEPFSNIDVFAGLASGNTSFVTNGTGGYTFSATGTNNTANFTADSAPVTANLVYGTVALDAGSLIPLALPLTSCPTGTASCDGITGVTTVLGSSKGDNVFVAGSGNETFGDTGGVGGDGIDFSSVPTSSTTPLTVNVSGAPVSGVANDTATAGATYTFTTGGSGFVMFTGSSNGNTSFLAGATPGYSFTASGFNDSIDFSAVPAGTHVVGGVTEPLGVTVALSGTNVSGVPAGTVTLPKGGVDTIAGLTTVVGSSGGGNTFTAGADGPYLFTGNGNYNTFVGSTGGGDVFASNGSDNIFTAGTGSATFTDTGTANTVNFGNLAATNLLTVNVSGGQVGATPSNTAAAGSSTYVFTSFGNAPTTFLGSPGGTTFYGGSAPDTFTGSAATPATNTLTFADASSNGSLTICLGGTDSGCPGSVANQAVLGSVKEPFSNIDVFAGLASGNTSFVTNGTGGYTFSATGTNNTADFTADGTPVTANLVYGTVALDAGSKIPLASALMSCPTGTASCDGITGVTTVLGSSKGDNVFVAGSGNETFGDTGGVGGDGIDFSNVATSSTTPLNINVSGTPVSGVGSDTAGVGSTTYTFTNGGADFVNFIGARNGYTHFEAPGDTGGYEFCATKTCTIPTTSVTGDVADFSANFSGVTADLSPSPEGGLTADQVSVGVGTPPDTVVGMATIIGSPYGPNVFYGGLTGTAFTATSDANTLSYLGYTAGPVTINLTSDTVTGAAPTDTFSFSPGTLTIQGSPGNDTFLIGTASVTLEGGGGSDTVNLSGIPAPTSGTTGADVDLNTGSIAGPSIGGVTFTPGCASASDLCVTSIIGSRYVDTFTANAAALNTGSALTITGNNAGDTLDLSAVPVASNVTMPLGTAKGSVAATTPGSANTGTITFTEVPNVIGTVPGGDDFTVGSGTESFTESGNPGTLNFSLVGTTSNGVTVNVTATGGVGTATGPSGLADTFSGMGTFVGTPGPDTFNQTGDGSYTFTGGLGLNVLNLSGVPDAEELQVSLMSGGPSCTMGTSSGSATSADVADNFTCMSQVITGGPETFTPTLGETTTINGGGNGTLNLASYNSGSGVDVVLPTTANGMGTVTDIGTKDSFMFTGVSTIDGTANDDLFTPGIGNVTINGEGGDDGVTFASAPAAVVVNLSSSSYTIPTGFTGAGTTVAADTATGGYGGVITLNAITNVIGTSKYNDIIVGGSGPGSLIGGSGNDRFVLTGGDDYIMGGTGSGTTLDLSLLTDPTTLNLADGSPQATGEGTETVTVVPGTIKTVIASPAGSQLQAGNGNGITLEGGTGNDWLAAGTGTQTLIGGGGTDTLVAGNGNDTLEGGAQPVTFVPGKGNDTLTSQGTGNTLSYADAPAGVQVNLSSSLYSVPQASYSGESDPMAGTTVAGLTASGGWGATVNLSQANVTNVIGSPQADLLVTSTAGGDDIMGGGGNDLIVINSGNNTLSAGTGTATRFLFVPGSGSNVISGGGAATVDFSQATAGVEVNLQTGSASGGFGGFQSLTGVLNIIGSNYADSLVAGGPGGTIVGLNAQGGQGDFLQAGPTGGDTLISDGNGNDTFCAESAGDASPCAVSGTSAGGGDTMTGGAGNDTFYARNGEVDVINGEGGFNEAQVDANDQVTNVQTLLQ